MHRLFAALRPPRATRDALAAIMGGIAGARWQDDDQLHVTLRFIGEVDARVAREVADALAGVRHEPLALGIAGVGTFDRKRRIDTLWAGVTPRERITALHRKLDAALVRAGLPPERRAYLPHVTLARLGRGAGPVAGFVAAHAALALPARTLDSFGLYESALTADGARYDLIERYPLS